MTAIQSPLPLTIEISCKQNTNHASQDLIHLGILTGNINSSQYPIKQCRSRKKKIQDDFKELFLLCTLLNTVFF